MSLMIRSQQINNCCESPIELIAVIGGIWHKIGVFAVAPDNDTILVVSKICHPKPRRAFRFVEIFLLTKHLDNFFWLPTVSDRFLT